MRRELRVICREMSGISEDDVIGWWGHTDKVLVVRHVTASGESGRAGERANRSSGLGRRTGERVERGAGGHA